MSNKNKIDFAIHLSYAMKNKDKFTCEICGCDLEHYGIKDVPCIYDSDDNKFKNVCRDCEIDFSDDTDHAAISDSRNLEDV